MQVVLCRLQGPVREQRAASEAAAVEFSAFGRPRRAGSPCVSVARPHARSSPRLRHPHRVSLHRTLRPMAIRLIPAVSISEEVLSYQYSATSHEIIFIHHRGWKIRFIQRDDHHRAMSELLLFGVRPNRKHKSPNRRRSPSKESRRTIVSIESEFARAYTNTLDNPLSQ